MMKLSLGFSPCPNDTFIFDALVNKKIDTGDIEVEAVLEDVETLNRWALEKKLDITKLSFGVLPAVLTNYALLKSGSALGKGVGPLLVAKDGKDLNVNEAIIAIPGEHTTAHLLFSLAYPEARNKQFMRYDAIEHFVLEGKGLGVIIHENRFTYADKGLIKVTDLGDYWERTIGQPIPLGGIMISRDILPEIQLRIDALIKSSIEYAYKSYPLLNDYIRDNAQEMSEEVMRKHIDLYVNEYSLNLGEAGEAAIEKLLAVYNTTHKTNINANKLFVG